MVSHQVTCVALFAFIRGCASSRVARRRVAVRIISARTCFYRGYRGRTLDFQRKDLIVATFVVATWDASPNARSHVSHNTAAAVVIAALYVNRPFEPRIELNVGSLRGDQ